jgi:hypothetical protein
LASIEDRKKSGWIKRHPNFLHGTRCELEIAEDQAEESESKEEPRKKSWDEGKEPAKHVQGKEYRRIEDDDSVEIEDDDEELEAEEDREPESAPKEESDDSSTVVDLKRFPRRLSSTWLSYIPPSKDTSHTLQDTNLVESTVFNSQAPEAQSTSREILAVASVLQQMNVNHNNGNNSNSNSPFATQTSSASPLNYSGDRKRRSIDMDLEEKIKKATLAIATKENFHELAKSAPPSSRPLPYTGKNHSQFAPIKFFILY